MGCHHMNLISPQDQGSRKSLVWFRQRYRAANVCFPCSGTILFLLHSEACFSFQRSLLDPGFWRARMAPSHLGDFWTRRGPVIHSGTHYNHVSLVSVRNPSSAAATQQTTLRQPIAMRSEALQRSRGGGDRLQVTAESLPVTEATALPRRQR